MWWQISKGRSYGLFLSSRAQHDVAWFTWFWGQERIKRGYMPGFHHVPTKASPSSAAVYGLPESMRKNVYLSR